MKLGKGRMPIMYFKSEPTDYVRISRGSKTKSGLGLSKIIMPSLHSVEVVSMAQQSQPFAFRERTQDNQDLTLNGELLYKVEDAEKLFSNFNYAIDPRTGDYLTIESQQIISSNLSNLVQIRSKQIVQNDTLENLIVGADSASGQIQEYLLSNDKLSGIGIKVEAVYLSSIEAQPEIANALGAEYREQLLTKASQAEYARRAKAVEQEKQIKTNEMTNKIDLEKEKSKLVELQSKNAIEEGSYQAKVAEMLLSPYKGKSADEIRAYALLEIGKNANRIDSLTITPELVGALNNYAGK